MAYSWGRYGFAMGFYSPHQSHIYGKCRKLAKIHRIPTFLMGITWSFIVLPYIQYVFCKLWENYGRVWFCYGLLPPISEPYIWKCRKLAKIHRIPTFLMAIIWSFIVLPYIQYFFCKLWENYGKSMVLLWASTSHIRFIYMENVRNWQFPYNMKIGIQYIHVAAVLFVRVIMVRFVTHRKNICHILCHLTLCSNSCNQSYIIKYLSMTCVALI